MLAIAQKLHPYSHLPGTSLLIPGTSCVAEVFPALVRLYDLSGLEKKLIREIPLAVSGPVEGFTVMQECERGVVSVFGRHLCTHILPTLELVYRKNPGIPVLAPFERLSLGSHKKQDWEGVKRRCDFREIFPLWHHLGGRLLLPPRQAKGGMFSLLERCRESVEKKRPEHILKPFRDLFLAGFEGLLVPRLHDTDHQGILQEGGGEASPLYLLTEGAALIRSLFIAVKGEEVTLLPLLPPEFFAGRFLHLETVWGTFHLEWTKKQVRQVFFQSKREGELVLHLPSGMKDFRVREGRKEKGGRHRVSEPMAIKSGTLYVWDRFQK